MAISPGDRLGPYTITSAIGRGGMGEVFRARDTRLNRDVAIKVLPDLFAGDPDRLARFEREAQVLASLNHPNIAHVHGLEESGGVRALVMELVEGATLADLIKAGPARGIPVAEALAIARQIAEALDVAHEKGVVHRDLKPANILVTPDRTVKVLDFGLAKALEPAGPASADLMNSPTFTGRVTEVGVILGTAAYMAPEQARGLVVDRRADIWAFGVVMYEMLTGAQPFDGGTATDVVAAVITREPDWSRLPSSMPDALVRVLKRCLEKDPKRRMRDIGDARAELDAASAPEPAAPAVSEAAAAGPARRTRVWLWAAGLALALAAGAAIGRMLLAPAPPLSTSVQFEIVVPERARAVMAPDGSRIVLASAKGLVIRDLDRLDTRSLPGTEGAQSPFWSEDSTTIVYGAKGRLWRVPVTGGTPALLSALPDSGWDQDAGGAWTADGGIVFTNGSSPLLRVPAAGGDPVTVVAAGQDDLHFHHASGLPDYRGVLFITHRKTGADTLELWTGSERRQLLRLEGSNLEHPVYSPTGHILFTRSPANTGLWAVRFALSRLEITGEPFLVTAGGVGPSISRTSRLAYVPVSGMPPTRLRWVDRQGNEIGLQAEPGILERWPSLSTDGSRAAVVERIDDRWDVWTYDLKSGARRRLTTDGFARGAIWMPDDESVVYTSVQPGAAPLMKRAAADGSGLLEELGSGREPAVSADGARLFYGRDFNLFHRPLVAAGREVAYVSGADRLSAPRPSPDGRFVAYVFHEASTFKRTLFVRPFPTGDARVEVAGNALNPRWSRDGRRLFYAVDADIMEVDVQTTPRFRVGVPRKLFSMSPLGASSVYPGFDVSADGQRFLTIESDAAATTQTVVVVLNFTPDK